MTEDRTAAKTAAGSWLDEIAWDAQGLVPAIAQDAASGKVLMLAWMDRAALAATAAGGEAVYYSRSRKQQWRKGEQSGHTQKVREIRLDCDGDVVTLQIEQTGGIACHTGHERCFFRKLENGRWVETEAVLKAPEHIYK
jgi:phosphoribosyl-AMP cyclohydrolase